MQNRIAHGRTHFCASRRLTPPLGAPRPAPAFPLAARLAWAIAAVTVSGPHRAAELAEKCDQQAIYSYIHTYVCMYVCMHACIYI